MIVFYLFYFFTFDLMTVKEYLLTKNEAVSQAYIARKMWPENPTSKSYLSNKLAGRLPWTEKNEEDARKILHDLGIELSNL